MSKIVLSKDEVLIIHNKDGIVALEYDPVGHCMKEVPICDKDGQPSTNIIIINEPR